jgi:hypothetical protein
MPKGQFIELYPVNASQTPQGASLCKLSMFPKRHKLICSKFDHLLLCFSGKANSLFAITWMAAWLAARGTVELTSKVSSRATQKPRRQCEK